jgi:hypothetical protein
MNNIVLACPLVNFCVYTGCVRVSLTRSGLQHLYQRVCSRPIRFFPVGRTRPFHKLDKSNPHLTPVQSERSLWNDKGALGYPLWILNVQNICYVMQEMMLGLSGSIVIWVFSGSGRLMFGYSAGKCAATIH